MQDTVLARPIALNRLTVFSPALSLFVLSPYLLLFWQLCYPKSRYHQAPLGERVDTSHRIVSFVALLASSSPHCPARTNSDGVWPAGSTADPPSLSLVGGFFSLHPLPFSWSRPISLFRNTINNLPTPYLTHCEAPIARRRSAWTSSAVSIRATRRGLPPLSNSQESRDDRDRPRSHASSSTAAAPAATASTAASTVGANESRNRPDDKIRLGSRYEYPPPSSSHPHPHPYGTSSRGSHRLRRETTGTQISPPRNQAQQSHRRHASLETRQQGHVHRRNHSQPQTGHMREGR
ncbi:hypothetical protein N7481_011775 [Penicillium waksmanii]|uniref:uncharacterized protein n=1 Tax=Penicillium waksmanii TaxID=69791 RepID=UPI0025485D90|nr:uncharacterized protein N7481_011775 [Penicillium waksmanii]KAJ5974565.1 hypothetical protein N7481_011775 [Penicillium waksmanii]